MLRVERALQGFEHRLLDGDARQPGLRTAMNKALKVWIQNRRQALNEWIAQQVVMVNDPFRVGPLALRTPWASPFVPRPLAWAGGTGPSGPTNGPGRQ
jgi:hypothetical protein